MMDQGTNTVTTDANRQLLHQRGVPAWSKWLVLEAFNTRYKTTGITYQADNQPTPTTLLGAAVDLNILPIIGFVGEGGLGAYRPTRGAGENGGHRPARSPTTPPVTRPTRASAATEPYQPGIPKRAGCTCYAVNRDENGDPIKKRPTVRSNGGPELNDGLHVGDLGTPAAGCNRTPSSTAVRSTDQKSPA